MRQPEPASLVSIGVPVYNGARHLPRVLDALLAQTYRSIEIIVSDNGSTDGTGDVARAYAATDPRVRVVCHDQNRGVEWNFRDVLGCASGDYFMWAAIDDDWLPPFVARLADELDQHPDAAVAMTGVARVRGDGTRLGEVRYGKRGNPNTLGHLRLAWALAAGRRYHLFIYGLFRTAFLRQAFTSLPPVAGADRLFMCHVALGTRFRYVDQVLHVRHVHERPFNKRYSDDPISATWRGYFALWHTAISAAPYLWRSSVIPPSRKVLVPAVVFRWVMRAAADSTTRVLHAAVGGVLGAERRHRLAARVRLPRAR